jgi:hypothetical protein
MTDVWDRPRRRPTAGKEIDEGWKGGVQEFF